MVVGRLLSFRDGKVSGAMLNFQELNVLTKNSLMNQTQKRHLRQDSLYL